LPTWAKLNPVGTAASVDEQPANIDDARIENGFNNDSAPVRFAMTMPDTGFRSSAQISAAPKQNCRRGGYFISWEDSATTATRGARRVARYIKLRGVNLDLVGRLPLTDRFSALGRVGVNYAQARDTFSGTGAVGVNLNSGTPTSNWAWVCSTP
jgi:OOP family OmpA-OmpF porin